MLFSVISIVILGVAGLTMLAITEKPIVAVAPFGALVVMLIVQQGIAVVVGFLLTLAGTAVFLARSKNECIAAILYVAIVPTVILLAH